MKKAFFTAIIMMAAGAAFAQSELKGNWVFKSQESIEGNLYSNGSPTSVKITTTEKELLLEKVTAGPNGDVTQNETINLDGKASETTMPSKRKKVITLKKDGEKYLLFTVLYNAVDPHKFDRKVTDTWYIENGELVLDRKDENLMNGETWESKATYTKTAQ